MKIRSLRKLVMSMFIATLSLLLISCNGTSSRKEVPKVVSLSLINSETGEPIANFDPISNGAVINMAKLPTRKLNIRANIEPEDFDGYVSFTHLGSNATFRDDYAPYTLNGDEKSSITGKVRYYGFPLELAKRTLQVTPYQDEKTAGTPLTITYEVIDLP